MDYHRKTQKKQKKNKKLYSRSIAHRQQSTGGPFGL